MPDALSKTVPIWCTVFNRLLFPELREAHKLNTPPKTVSASEHSQIEERLDGFVQQLKNLDIDISGLQSRVTKPLRPIWITRDSLLPDGPPCFSDFYPVVLVTASRRVSGVEMSEGGYIQGAGDDSEGWSCGLTASMFWQNHRELLETSESRLRSLISELVEIGAGTETSQRWAVIQPTSWLMLGTTRSLHKFDLAEGTLVVDCAEESDKIMAAMLQSKYLHLKCRPKKLGSRDLRKELPKILRLVPAASNIRQVYICCLDGKDISVGVALAILCLFSDSSGSFRGADDNQAKPHITKQFIQHRLSWIMTSFPGASPSRATLQSINDFLFTSVTLFPPASPLPQARLSSRIVAIFRALSGEWAFYRTLTNHERSLADPAVTRTIPAGVVSGTAIFQPRFADSEGSSWEYLYTESGILKSTNGEFPVHRQWLWNLSSPTLETNTANSKDMTLSIYFVRPDGQTVDYLYQELDFSRYSKSNLSKGQEFVIADAVHPCGADLYTSTYCFVFDNEKTRKDTLVGFKITHDVRGPKKDYSSVTEFTRGEP